MLKLKDEYEDIFFGKSTNKSKSKFNTLNKFKMGKTKQLILNHFNIIVDKNKKLLNMTFLEEKLHEYILVI